MDSRNNTRAKMIIWLRDAIEHEISKPDDEIDYELVDELSKLLSELMGDQECLTDEEAKQRLAQIVERKPKKVKRKPRVKLKRLVMIACAAMVMVGGTMAIGAFDGSFKNMLKFSYTMDSGKSFDENGATFEIVSDSTVYSSFEKLIEAEKLDIKYPKDLPDGVEVEKVLYNKNDNGIVVIFNDNSLQMEIHGTAYMPMDNIIKNSSKLQHKNIDTYITNKGNIYSSYTIINDYIYIIISDTKEKNVIIINGMIGDTK